MNLRPTTILLLATLPALPLVAQDAPSPAPPPVLAVAAPATTQPSADATPADAHPQRPPARLRSRLAERFGLNNDRADRNAEPPSDEEWAHIKAFMAENSPRRARAIERLPAEKSAGLRRLIASRYRQLMQLKSTDETLYALRLKSLALEDERFSLQQQLLRPNADRDELTRRLKDNLAQSIDYGLRERRHRIQKLEADLDHQKAKLAADEQNRDALVNEQLAKILAPHAPRPKKESATAESDHAPAPDNALSSPDK